MKNDIEDIISRTINSLKENYRKNTAIAFKELENYTTDDGTQHVLKVLYKLSEPYPNTKFNFLIVKTIKSVNSLDNTDVLKSEIFFSDETGSYIEKLSGNFQSDPDKAIEGLGYDLIDNYNENIFNIQRILSHKNIKNTKYFHLVKEELKNQQISEQFEKKFSNLSFLFLNKQNDKYIIVSDDIFLFKLDNFESKLEKLAKKLLISEFPHIDLLKTCEIKFKKQKIEGKILQKCYFKWIIDNPYQMLSDFLDFDMEFLEIKSVLNQLSIEFSFK